MVSAKKSAGALEQEFRSSGWLVAGAQRTARSPARLPTRTLAPPTNKTLGYTILTGRKFEALNAQVWNSLSFLLGSAEVMFVFGNAPN